MNALDSLKTCLTSSQAALECSRTSYETAKTFTDDSIIPTITKVFNEGILEKYSDEVFKTWYQFQTNPTLWSLTDLLITVTGLKEAFKNGGLASLALVSTTAKNSLKNVAETFFKICPLPSSLPMIDSSTNAFDYSALKVIAAIVTIESLFSSCVRDKNIEKQIDNLTAGTVIGTTMSWIFDQDLYVGAFSGFLAGATKISLSKLYTSILPSEKQEKVSRLFSETQKKLSDFWIKSKIGKTLNALPIAIFFLSTAYIAEQSPDANWPIAFAISSIPALASYYTLFHKAEASQKILSKAYLHLAPIAWTGYLSMTISLAYQHYVKSS